MSMELTVLGSCGGYPRPGRACSGYLLRSGSDCVVMDLGTGTLSNLLLEVGPGDISALLLSHMHPDHYVDVYPLYTARRFNLLEPGLPMFLPEGGREALDVTITGPTRKTFFEYLAPEIMKDGETYRLGELSVTVRYVKHALPAVGFRVEANGTTLCYTGDTGPCEAVTELARGADVLLCESTFTSELTGKVPGHMFAVEAGRLAREAAAGRLLLTHVWPTLSEKAAVEDAGTEFDGPVEAAYESLTLQL